MRPAATLTRVICHRIKPRDHGRRIKPLTTIDDHDRRCMRGPRLIHPPRVRQPAGHRTGQRDRSAPNAAGKTLGAAGKTLGAAGKTLH
jgi:hypothetical protein